MGDPTGGLGEGILLVVRGVDPVCVLLRRLGGWGASVAESVLAPPGPIPNPVVTQRSAGEYWGGDPLGGEAAADAPHPRSPGGGEGNAPKQDTRRGVEQRQLVGLITQRSGVRIPPPLPEIKRPSI